jgi:hypothetical protein
LDIHSRLKIDTLRNLIGGMLIPLNIFRQVATSSDKLAINFSLASSSPQS